MPRATRTCARWRESRHAVERLWDACQVPDYRKIAPATHAELVVTLYGFLMREGNIPTDWFARQVAQADRTDGDIDTLSNRIAHVRTWTFVANRPDWLADPEHWQGVTRAVEDKLSDALHERLAERFVDRRTSVLMRRLRENTMLETEIGKTGEVDRRGPCHRPARRLHVRARRLRPPAPRPRRSTPPRRRRWPARSRRAPPSLSQAPNDQIVLANDGALRWTGDVGRQADRRRRRAAAARAHRRRRASDRPGARSWCRRGSISGSRRISRSCWRRCSRCPPPRTSPAWRAASPSSWSKSLGVLERQKVAEEVKGLDQPARATLRKYGVRFGAYHIYLPALLKPAPRALATQLWALKHESPEAKGVDELLHLAAAGRTSIPVDKDTPKALYRTAGYRVCGERAVRVDILERLADLIRPALSWREGAPGPKPAGAFDGRGFTVTGAMTSLTGASGEDFASILRSLGYRMDRRPKPAGAAQKPDGSRQPRRDASGRKPSANRCRANARRAAEPSRERPTPLLRRRCRCCREADARRAEIDPTPQAERCRNATARRRIATRSGSRRQPSAKPPPTASEAAGQMLLPLAMQPQPRRPSRS